MKTVDEIAFNACEVSTRVLKNRIKEYASLQIKADRKRIIKAYYDCTYHDTFNDLVKTTPIILD